MNFKSCELYITVPLLDMAFSVPKLLACPRTRVSHADAPATSGYALRLSTATSRAPSFTLGHGSSARPWKKLAGVAAPPCRHAAVQAPENAGSEQLGQAHSSLQAACMERIAAWCSTDNVQSGSTHMLSYAIKGKPWSLAVMGAAIRSPDGSSSHAVVCFAVHSPGMPPSGGHGGSGADQPSGLLLHWGCSDEARGKWQPPPPGWHTSPAVSYDAGGGAWQTPFTACHSTSEPIHVMLLQLPMQGPIRQGGLSFVLKTEDGHWLQNASDKNFFFSTASLRSMSANIVAAPAVLKKQVEREPSEGSSQAGTEAGAESDSGAPSPWATAASLLGTVEESSVKAFVQSFKPTTAWTELMASFTADDGGSGDSQGPSKAVSKWMVEAIARQESNAERSLMHRFNTAQQLVEQAGKAEDPQEALTAVLMWLRLSAARHLTWNRNYNVKPREISAAQERLNTSLGTLFDSLPQLRPVVVPCMAAAGRGGSSDVGQRIRDEILAVQSRNHCKGGMMEEWHQKLHNNTSPDDVVICQALIAMLEEGLDIKAYWRTLHASGITAQRLASFDRSIKNEPKFSPEQVPGLLVDLRAYLQTLQSVHSGADLGSAAGSVLGFSQKSMKGKLVTVEAVPGAASPALRQLLLAILYQQHQVASAAGTAGEASASEASGSDGREGPSSAAVSAAVVMLQLVLEARHMLRPIIKGGNSACGGRLHDVLFLDMALDSSARTTLETVMSHVKAEANSPAGAGMGARDWAMQVVAVVDRLKRSLSDQGHQVITWLQPTSSELGSALGVPSAATCLMCEDAARGTSIAPVAQLLAAVEPSVRRLGGQGEWQIISRGLEQGAVEGLVRVEASLATVQYETCKEPTVLIVDHVTGQEEVPEGAVVVLTSGDCPDVLSHSAVRARNMGVLMAACLNDEKMASIKGLAGSKVSVSLFGSEVKVNNMAQ